jgi:tetratricopeptide (TPR) repeat protein
MMQRLASSRTGREHCGHGFVSAIERSTVAAGCDPGAGGTPPKSGEKRYEIGMSALPEALERLSAAIPADAALDTALLSAAARAAVQRGDLEGARALLLLLLSKDGQSAPSWAFFALVLRDLGERGDAAFAAERGVALAPADLFARGVARSLGLVDPSGMSEIHGGGEVNRG